MEAFRCKDDASRASTLVAPGPGCQESLVSLALEDVKTTDTSSSGNFGTQELNVTTEDDTTEDDKDPPTNQEFALIGSDIENPNIDVAVQDSRVQSATTSPSWNTPDFADKHFKLIDSNGDDILYSERLKDVRVFPDGITLGSATGMRAKPVAVIESDRNVDVQLVPDDYFGLADYRLRDVANRIDHMASGRKARWNQYQIELAEAESKTKQEFVRSARNIEFPDIATGLQAARVDLETGKTEKFWDSLEKQYGTEKIALIRRSVASRGGAGGFNQPGLNRVDNAEIMPGVEINGAASARFDRSRLPDPLEQLEKFLNRRSETPLLPARNLPVDLFRFNPPSVGLSQKAGWRELIDAAIKGRVDKRMAEIDSPGLGQLIDLRLQRLNEKILDENAKEAVRNCFDGIGRNRYLSEREKIDTLQQFDRLIQDSDSALVPAEDRLLLASQLGLQVNKIDQVDQGHFKTCNFSTIEKVMSLHHTNHIARMIADVALTGETRTVGGRLIKIDPKCLRPADDAALSLHKDGERSLVSQYFAQISAEIRFQQFNEKFGTALKYALLNGEERVMDFSGSAPREVYCVDVDSGKVTLVPEPELLLDGRRVVDKNLQPESTKPLDSPKVRASDVLDVYKEMSGRDTDAMFLIHYEMAKKEQHSGLRGCYERFMETEPPVDKRQQLYRNADELESSLRKAKFPVFFAECGHITTINSFDKTSRKSDYDNQWGHAHDRIGSNGLIPEELEKRGSDVEYLLEDYRRLLELRRQYEQWCADTGVEFDVRYPTKDELDVWRKGSAK